MTSSVSDGVTPSFTSTPACAPASNVAPPSGRVALAATHGLTRRLRPWLASRQPGQRAGEAGAIQVVDARHRRPVVDLVLAADAAAEVDAPDVAGAALEAQRLERNPDLGRPAVGVAPASPPTTRASQLVLTSRPSLAICVSDFAPAGVGDEDEAVAAIGERVEQHLERVLLARREVLADVVDDRRLPERSRQRTPMYSASASKAMRTSVGSVAGSPSCGSAWTKPVAGRSRAPDLLVERAVDLDRRARLDGADDAPAVGAGWRRGLSRRGLLKSAKLARRKKDRRRSPEGAGASERVGDGHATGRFTARNGTEKAPGSAVDADAGAGTKGMYESW